MKNQNIFVISVLAFIIVVIWVLTENVNDFIFSLISALFTGILVEIFYWRKARKKGKKDLIDILNSLFKKST